MRRTLVVIHRWFGLFTAVFLFIAGATGTVIAWEHELDAWLNPQLYRVANPAQPPRSSLSLATELETRDPRLRVRYLPLSPQPGQTLRLFVEPRLDLGRDRLHPLDFDEIAFDPATGAIQGTRDSNAISLDRAHLLSFLYRLHYTLHLPQAFGLDLGLLFMGMIAVVWALDALVALWISFPSLKAWRKSFRFRVREGGYRLIFDLHRSGGVWVWPLLLMFAVTAVSMNLRDTLMRPLVSLFSPLAPNPLEQPLALAAPPKQPVLSRERALEIAAAEARRLGVSEPLGGIYYGSQHGIYAVGLFAPGRDHGDGSLGVAWIYVDALSGKVAGADIPGEGSAGDVFMQAQFPLHSGRIAGVPGRILVSLMGLAVAMLSVTGLVIWARKRRARAFQAQRAEAEGARSAPGASAPAR